MGVSKVDYGDRTLIDLTQDTVTADKLMQGYTAHGANGERIVGTATGGSGDMLKSDYDNDSAVANAGGIADYVEGKVAPMLNVLGAKNLLKNNAVSQTINGVTFTVNSDGSVILNGTASDNGFFNLNTNLVGIFTADMYVGLGAESATQNGYTLSHGVSNSEFTIGYTLSNHTCWIGILNGKVYNNVTVYPMIRLASIEDDTYEPYSMTNQQLTPYAQSQSNPNLIDNPWFTVNERGRRHLPSISYSYWMDRWKNEGLTDTDINCELSSYGLKIPSYSGYGQTLIEQYIGPEKINKFNRRYTLSVMYSDGSIESETGVIPTSTSSSYTVLSFESQKGISLELSNIGTTGNYQIRIVVESEIPSEIIIRAVKLELGDVSTLAQDVMPDYATELLKCQMSTIDSQDTYAHRNVVNAELQLVQSCTLSTSSEVNCTFTSDYIHSNSDIDVSTDVYGVLPCKVEAYPGTCVVTFPKQSSAEYIYCKICVKNNMV